MERLDPRFPRPGAGGRVERADLAAYRHGGRTHHAVWTGRHPADHAASRCLFATPAAPGRQGAPDRLATGDGLSRLRTCAEPESARSCSYAQRLHRLFRGAGYRSFSGGIPEDAEHAALASDYAHTTAPIRRLVDRYSGEICVALCADQPIPAWVLRDLDALPDQMAAAERRAKKYEKAIIDLLEVYLLADRVGQTFLGTVIDVDRDKKRGRLMITEPAIEARVMEIAYASVRKC